MFKDIKKLKTSKNGNIGLGYLHRNQMARATNGQSLGGCDNRDTGSAPCKPLPSSSASCSPVPPLPFRSATGSCLVHPPPNLLPFTFILPTPSPTPVVTILIWSKNFKLFEWHSYIVVRQRNIRQTCLGLCLGVCIQRGYHGNYLAQSQKLQRGNQK